MGGLPQPFAAESFTCAAMASVVQLAEPGVTGCGLGEPHRRPDAGAHHPLATPSSARCWCHGPIIGPTMG